MFVHIAMRLLFFQQPETDKNGFLAANGGMEFNVKNYAIKENHLYRKIYASGKKAYGKYTVVYVLKDKKASRLKKENPRKRYINRIGLTVTKKLGKAVRRNRIKRIIRAALAETEKTLCLKKGFLIVIAAREAAGEATSAQIFEELCRQFKKLDMEEREKSVPMPEKAAENEK